MFQKRAIYPSLTLFFCLANLSLSYAGPFNPPKFPGIRVNGTVTDSITKQYIPNATVSALDDKGVLLSQTKTNSQGYYQLSTVKRPKTVSIQVEASGYISQAKGGALSPYRTYTMNFSLISNRPPSLAPIRPKLIRTNQMLRFRIIAIDPDKDPLVYSASNLPEGAGFDPESQIFSWKPTYEQAGRYNVKFEVSDGKLIDSETLTIIVKAMDIIPPTGSLKINNDNPYTNSTTVTLNLLAQDNENGSGLSQMQFSNDNQTWSSPEDYATTKTWALTAGDGSKTVYAKFSDKAGNWSTLEIKGSIVLDTTKPAPPTVTDDGQYTGLVSQLHSKWVSGDSESGITEYQYSIGTQAGAVDILNWASTTLNEVTVTGLNLNTGYIYYFNIKAKNGAGLWSNTGSSNGIGYRSPPQICRFGPANKSSFMEEDTVPIAIYVKIVSGITHEFQLSVDDLVVRPWSKRDAVYYCSPLGNSSYVSYNWQTKKGDYGYHKIRFEVRDNRVEPVSKEITIFIFRRPQGPPG